MFRRTALQKRKPAEQKMSAIQSLFDLATRATDGETFADVGIVLLQCIGKHMPASPIRDEIERICFSRVQHSLNRRSEEQTSDLQSLMRISYAVFCLQKKLNNTRPH